MRSFMSKIVSGGTLTASLVLGGCSADIHGNSVGVDVNATVMATTSVNVNEVQAGESIPVQVAVSNVTLVDPSTSPPADVTNAAYLQFYIDSTSGTPVLVTAQTSVTVMVPASEPPGGHKLLCQVYKHDGTPTSTTTEIDFTVTASVSVNPADAGTAGD
jgi:predicted component of type VI protein secretion system